MNGTVLIVENEVLIHEALEDIFEAVGFSVIGAGDGHEGVSAYQSYQDEIDLVILDVRLPGMDGAEVLRELRAINPNVKVIVSSGYDEQEITERLEGQLPVPILKKPYNAQTLLSKVQSVLAN